ncbi:hypothetical protein BBP40_002533 [Aspergillus hancockii]|nr:hypothetical protein BBP40_002533 [Aspergillus hancockii]
MERRSDAGTAHMAIVIRAIVLVLAIPTTLVCVLRLYQRKFVTKQFGLDDWLALAALAMDLFSVLAYTITYYGLGKPLQEVSADQLMAFLTLEYASQCAYLVVAATVKASLLALIMRLFPTRFVRNAGKCLLGFITAFTVSGTLALVFQCQPVQAAYDMTIAGATCYPRTTSYAILMTQGVIMFVQDVLILILPIKPIWELQMPRTKRLTLTGLFCIGLTACVASLVRFSTLRFTNDTSNITYSASMSLIWMEIEFNLGLMSGSLSSLHGVCGLWGLFDPARDGTDGDSTYTAHSELGARSWGQQDIFKKTEIIRVVEVRESQESIAPRKS